MKADAMRFVVDATHPALAGHFPGRPIVPGVVLLAHVQAAIEESRGPFDALRLPQAKFMQPLLPGEAAVVELLDPAGGAIGRGDAARWRFRVLRDSDGAVLASGEFTEA